MDLNYFDVVLLVILVLFLLRGIMNGVLAEFSGLLGLFGGLWYANHAYKDVAPYLAKIFQHSAWRDLAAYGLVFVSVLVAAALLVHVLSKVLSLKALPSLDKSLGAILGLVRGMVICSISLVILRHFLPDMHFFSNSLVTPWMEPFLNFAKLYLPASLV
jgi:membrane protein required for colicin V production